MKDLFIDAEIANKFAKPNKVTSKLIQWLTSPETGAHLVVSPKLIQEYLGGNMGCHLGTSIGVIFEQLQREKRLNKKSNNEIQQFQAKYFSKKVWNSLRCKRPGSNDPSHLALILLSERKMALIDDDDFLYDARNFKGFKVVAERDPQLLNYK